MQHAHDGLAGISRIVACCDADVGWRTTAERMGRPVEPGVRRFEPGPLGQMPAQRLLPRRIEIASQRKGGGVRGLPLQRMRQRCREPRGVLRKDGRHLRRRHAGLKSVHERVVRVQPKCRRQRGSGLSRQVHDLRQRRADRGEVGRRPGRAPNAFAGGVRTLPRFDQVSRQGGGADMGMAHQRQVGTIPSGGRVGLTQIGGGGGVSQHAMHGGRQDGHLVTPRGTTAGGHHGCGIPSQDGHRLSQRRDAGKAVLQADVSSHAVSLGRRAWRAYTANTASAQTAKANQVTA